MLDVEHLNVFFGDQAAVSDVSFRIQAGEWWVLVGPNGSGKTTLANALTRGVKYTGSILLDGRNAASYKTSEYARKVGILSQMNTVLYAYTVREVAEMGRYAHREGFLRGKDPGGEEKIRQVLEMTGLTGIQDRSILTLSGGEAQRVFLAQVLIQDPNLLILDEPANHLDLPFQQELFGLVASWLREPGRAVITVMHDLSLARRFGTKALLLNRGKCVAQGDVRSVLSRENLRQVYGMDVHTWMRELFEQWNEE